MTHKRPNAGKKPARLTWTVMTAPPQENYARWNEAELPVLQFPCRFTFELDLNFVANWQNCKAALAHFERELDAKWHYKDRNRLKTAIRDDISQRKRGGNGRFLAHGRSGWPTVLLHCVGGER